MEKNIVAIIPARAGSKGIPNKNLRILAGHPLLYYAIRTARKSRYINRVILSTDLDDGRELAKIMGAEYHQRPEHLAADNVTLDAVICDAAAGIDCDYVITLQPTTPTLRTETLDAAIQKMVSGSMDSLVSVVNRPHQFWYHGESGLQRFMPAVNRQQMPPLYYETGAFVISSAQTIAAGSRFGPITEVFETPESESIDIDSFEDLVAAENALQSRPIAFFVNGNAEIGMGHIYRTLEIADEFYSKPDIYYDRTITDPASFGYTTHTLIPVEGNVGFLESLRNKNYGAIINDILNTDEGFMHSLKQVQPHAGIVNFEDAGEGSAIADIVINAMYEHSGNEKTFSGPAYFVINKRFLLYEPITIHPGIRRVFISFGGADPGNYTEMLLEIIRDESYAPYDFTVVLGRVKHISEALLSEIEGVQNISIHRDVTDMPALMSLNDIGICSYGRTSYELAFLGIPPLILAQHEREYGHGMFDKRISSVHGPTICKPHSSRAEVKMHLDRLLATSQAERAYMQAELLSHDLRGGRKRVMGLIQALIQENEDV
ncbi:MAG: cytidyltransferase [Actinomycetes bacterium]|jgi:CMP-N-acetylneuraminic acid synthetase/spore coat polysaccharide biosynthesis predicted glycosyltransferase SpsG|nr:cytidyltransferase [Actinomycetes bacterium]